MCTVTFQLIDCPRTVNARKYPHGFRDFLKVGMEDRELRGTIQIYHAKEYENLRSIEVIAQGSRSNLDDFRMHLGTLTVSQLLMHMFAFPLRKCQCFADILHFHHLR